MPIYLLSDSLVFPPVEAAEPEGILAVGGGLSTERLLVAYRSGIFPWYEEGQPILWWAPDPRFVLFPDRLKISASMARLLKSGRFSITSDRAFDQVIENCRCVKRKNQDGTWLTSAMVEAYRRLHEAGYAHSVEVWESGALAGGLYGVSLGRAFFGESMFAKCSNASKAGFITLTQRLEAMDFQLIDCQIYSEHLEGFGAELVPRATFMSLLDKALEHDTACGNWAPLFNNFRS